jgi:preprotein translocase subunit SecG
MIIVVTILHVIMCLILIAMVLLQTGKGASMGAAFGGGSNTVFGAAGPASFLNKLTTVAAVVFMVTSFTLAIMSSRANDASRVLDAPVQQEETVTEEASGEADGTVDGTEETVPETSEETASETATDATVEETPATE